jgi:hypothetical protein
MSYMTAKLSTAVAGLALASLPVLVDAQGTTTPQTRPEQSTPSQQNRSSRMDQNSPDHHLDQARRVLTSLNSNTVQGEARSQVNELKRHFNQLESAWRASSAGSARTGASRSTEPPTGSSTTGSTSGTATTGTTGTTTEQTTGTSTQPRTSQTPRTSGGSGDWMTHYTAIDRLLEQMIGTSSASTETSSATSSTSSSSTTSGTTGTTGSATEREGTTGARSSGATQLDASVKSKLQEFKGHLDKFHAAAMSQSGRGEEDAASANRQTGVTGSMSPTGTSGTSSTTPTTSSTSSTPSPTTSSTPPTSTSTSAATGTTGTTMSQTTQPSSSSTIDSAAIARLTASIDEMLRGSSSTSTTTTTTSSGTSGTVGTSGTTSSTGTVCVDRAKLEELKTQIQALQNRPR